jgi:hypothetical protein
MTSPEQGTYEFDDYEAPEISPLGTLSEQTLTRINKSGANGDVIVLNGQDIPVPGSSIVP